MANVKFKRLLTSELASEAIEDGKTIWIKDGNNGLYMDVGTTREQMIATDTALSTTSTNPIQNQALTNSIVNDLATAIATTADRIPCGTKAVKEISTWTDISSLLIGKLTGLIVSYALYNPATKEVKIDMTMDTTALPNVSTIFTFPLAYRPSRDIILYGCGSAKLSTNVGSADWLSLYAITIGADGTVRNSYMIAQNMYYFRANFSYIVR